MASEAAKIRKLLRELEKGAIAASSFRDYAKYDTKLTPFGAAIVEAGKEHDVPQWVIVKILDVSASAVSKRYTA